MIGIMIEDDRVMAPADQPAGGPPSVQPAPAQQSPAEPISQAELERRRKLSHDLAANLGYVVSIMLHVEPYRAATIASLEKLVLPAIATRQFRIAEGLLPANGAVAPLAVVMWASVSAEVDARIASAIDQPIELKPADWRSGDIVWIVEAMGDNRAVSSLLEQLKKTEMKDKTVRMRIRGADGKFGVGRLEFQPAPPPQPPA